jgi:hypothetical protein
MIAGGTVVSLFGASLLPPLLSSYYVSVQIFVQIFECTDFCTDF